MENLNTMLQKIVYLNDYKTIEVTGFLMKIDNDYIIKVIDSKNDNNERHDIITLDERLAKFVEISDKPKLMKVSMKSWRYKAMKYVLRKHVPTPHNMQNGCPVFWLMVFSLIIIPFVFIGRTILNLFKWAFYLPSKFIDWIVKDIADSWVNEMTEEAIVDLYFNYNDKLRSNVHKKAFGSSGRNSDSTAYKEWIKRNLNFDPDKNLKKYNKLVKKHEKLANKIYERRNKMMSELYLERDERKEAKRKKEDEFNKKYIEPITSKLDKMISGFKKAFIFKYNMNKIIKLTKKFVSLIITLLISAITITSTMLLVKGVIFITDALIEAWNLEIILLTLGIIIIFIILVGLFNLIKILGGKLINKITFKYENNGKVWFIEILKYLIIIPLKYIGIGLAYVFLYVIWYPICVWLFYKILWKWLAVAVIARFFKSIGRGFKNSGNMFLEYNGKAYTDMCPPVEWIDLEEEYK